MICGIGVKRMGEFECTDTAPVAQPVYMRLQRWSAAPEALNELRYLNLDVSLSYQKTT